MIRLFVVAGCLILSAGVAITQPQSRAETSRRVVRYRLIDLGTLGGPNSAETVEFPYINNRGMVVGFADTSVPNPFNPGSYIPHAFKWQRGVFTDLGTLPGGSGSFAVWSNDRGQVVGLSDDGHIDPVLGGPEGFATLWNQDGASINLGTLGGTQSLAGDINQRGDAVGVAANSIPDPFSMFGWATQTRAALWQDGQIVDLGTLGGTDAVAIVINDRGQIAGASYTGSDPTPSCFPPGVSAPLRTGAFLWQWGRMVRLPDLGGTCTFPVGLNNRGQIAGESSLPGDQTAHPVLWHDGRLQDLGTLGGSFGTTTGINERGDVIGAALTTGDQQIHAFFWSRGVMTDIGTVEGDICSIPHFVNSSGLVSGTSGNCTNPFELHGFLWQPGGSVINLNDFVPPDLDLIITDGETINDSGEIAGSGLLPNGDFHAIVLVPCDWAHGGVTKGCLPARQRPTTAAAQSEWGPETSTTVVATDLREVLRRHRGSRGIVALGNSR